MLISCRYSIRMKRKRAKELLVESLMILSLVFNLQALHVSSDLGQYKNGLEITKYHIPIVNKNPAIYQKSC